MTTATISINAATKDRLESLRVPGLTFDDVINFALDHLDPLALKKSYEDWQRAAFSKLLSGGKLRQTKR